jgi:hypothetical protein
MKCVQAFDRKQELRKHVGKSRRRWENKINLHQEMCKGMSWNGFNRLRIRTDEDVF